MDISVVQIQRLQEPTRQPLEGYGRQSLGRTAHRLQVQVSTIRKTSLLQDTDKLKLLVTCV